VTLEPRQVEARLGALLDALDASAFDILFTAPNADTRNRVVAQRIDEYVASRPQAELVASLGSRGYLTVLGRARAMVGNSSSGIIEAASFELPVVNVGMRQQGRLRARNVIDVGDSAAEILQGIRVASSDEFCAGLVGLENPYGDGHAAPRIAEVLAEISLDDKLLIKRFHDLPGASG
jgi:UDP-N-acetylglucosamine 2-epimerase